MIAAAPSKASAQVFVSVRVGPVVPRPSYVVVHPRPYPYAYYPRPVVFAPVYVRPVRGYYYRETWRPRPVVYRGYARERCFRR